MLGVPSSGGPLWAGFLRAPRLLSTVVSTSSGASDSPGFFCERRRGLVNFVSRSSMGSSPASVCSSLVASFAAFGFPWVISDQWTWRILALARGNYGTYPGTSPCSSFLPIIWRFLVDFTILCRVRSSTSGLLNPHFSAKQLLPICLRYRFAHVILILECDECIALTSPKPFRQANIGARRRVSTTNRCQRGEAYIFIPAKASLKSCSELL